MDFESFDMQSFAQALSVPTQEALEVLPQFQKQNAAWQFAFDMLASDNINCRFFGAHTLQVKIARDWNTLDEERQSALRPELIRLVAEQCDAPLHVLNKVNQALITYALHTVPEQWSDFLPTAIEAIQQKANDIGKDSISAGQAVVDLLGLFPEELMRTNISSDRNAKLVQDTKTALPIVLDLLTSIVQGVSGSTQAANAPPFTAILSRDPSWRTRAWKAILQWLQFGIPGDTLFTPLLEMSLQKLNVLATLQLRRDATPASMQVSEDEAQAATAAVDDMVSNVNMAGKYAQTVGTLVLENLGQPWLSEIIKQCIDEQDSQAALQWSSILVSFGETYTDFIVRNITTQPLSEHIATFLQIVLALTQFPGFHAISEDVSDQPLNFWYLLQETMVDYEYEAEDDEVRNHTLPETKAAIKRAFVELLSALVSKSAFPPSDTWLGADKEEKDKFLSYRREVGDALLNTYYVLREEMLGLLVDEVLSSVSSFSLHNWQHVESLLFALRSIGESAPDTESVHLPRLFSGEMLSQHFLPVLQTSLDTSDRGANWGLNSIKSSILSLIGAYGEWWKSHPELLPIVVPCVTSSLNQPALVTTAVTSFRRICDSCRDQLAGASAGMVQLASEVLVAGTAVPPREQQRIFESVAEVLMALSPEQQVSMMTPLLAPLTARLDSDLKLLKSAPGGLSLVDLEPYMAPLTDHLRLVESLSRGFQFADDIEEMALMGEPESADMLLQAAQCYNGSGPLQEFRSSLLVLMNHVFLLHVWQRDQQTGMVQIDDGLLECMLSIINSSSRRGPHAFAQQFGDICAFIGNAWSAAIANSGIYGIRWTDQCPLFLQCISQLVTVFTGASNGWRLVKPSSEETDKVLGAVLSRVVNDIYMGISKEAASFTAAIEQQPVINESAFDLCTRALQIRPQLFSYLGRSSVGRICELSVQALSIPNRLALKPTAYFLTALIRLSSSGGGNKASPATDALLAMLWNEYGVEWLRTTLAGIGGAHPRSLLPNLSELLFTMVKHHPDTTRQGMSELLAQPGFPSPHVNDATKRLFVQQALATRSFIKFKGAVSEFSIKCRNLQGTAYTAV
ncbi:hypothetical protein GGI12_002966 [Dipsacomyces acuminosporus]|nr:hypothetical protein GGI12_002966 [Dipsacomyces acuminosporus]